MRKKLKKYSFFKEAKLINPYDLYKIIKKKTNSIIAFLIISTIILGDLYIISLIFGGTYKGISVVLFIASITLWPLIGLFGIYCFIFGTPTILMNLVY